MDENQFWARTWLTCACLLIVLVTSCTVNSFDRRAKWEKAVANGADPLRTSCALLDMSGTGDQIICAMLAAKEK
jgi:pyridoxal/pyridoxine/pyridoxamine kinase